MFLTLNVKVLWPLVLAAVTGERAMRQREMNTPLEQPAEAKPLGLGSMGAPWLKEHKFGK